ncbi:MAG TPA: ABC transporter ATP-binding protein [Candidatus Competibacteraceae bacterium]|nr:ABC transporter ATP-binding protein [Candidatus Competibacteraceae bacterium]
MSEAEPLLEIENLRISYYTRAGAVPAVVDFNLTLHAGECVGLVGESGCGKSTVAMAIMQYLGRNGAVTGGSIRFKGRDLCRMDAAELRRIRGSQIAMVYQEPMAALNPSLTIARQLMEVPMVHEGVSGAEAEKRARQALADVHLPDPERVLRAYPHQLSGGQQQRVVIAMALLSRPALLLLDEPTTALDVTVEAGIVKLIRELGQRYGMAQLFISHNLGLVLETCDRVCVMYSGEAVEQGSVREVFSQPRHPYTHGLFHCIPLPGADKNARPLQPIPGQLPLPHERPRGCYFGPRCSYFQAGRCDAADIPMEMVEGSHRARCLRWREIDWGAADRATAPRPAPRVGEPVLVVERMKKYYAIHDLSLGALLAGRSERYIKANEALDFDARRGETVAIVGESGCGKSTFARVLMGLETATDGVIRFQGLDISRTPVRERSAKLVSALQMVFQNPSDTLNPSLSVGAQIGRVIRKFTVERERSRIRERVLKLLDEVKLPREFYYRKPRQLSGGQKQRVGIARAFAGNPALVIADEPVSALDVSVAAAVTELLTEIQRQHGTTLLFISHDLSVVRYLADRIVVMYLGRIMERGTTEQIFSPPYHPYTEALLSAVPIADPRVEKEEIVLEGSLPSPLAPPKGCPFCTRCHLRLGSVCDNEPPPLRQTAAGHVIACHIPLEELRKRRPVIRVVEALRSTA